jgi:predicted nucleic-acid-binding protein
MIALDTNALLRWMFDEKAWPDGSGQIRRIRAAVAETDGAVYVNDVVLAESVWVMRSHLGLSRVELGGALRTLVESAAVEIDRRSAVVEALARFEAGGAGFVDHLIGVLNRDAGCGTTLTFDRVAARAPDFTAIP